jgi:hypothetical protein
MFLSQPWLAHTNIKQGPECGREVMAVLTCAAANENHWGRCKVSYFVDLFVFWFALLALLGFALLCLLCDVHCSHNELTCCHSFVWSID